MVILIVNLMTYPFLISNPCCLLTILCRFEQEAANREVDILVLLQDHPNVVEFVEQWSQETDLNAESQWHETQKRKFPAWKGKLADSFEEKYASEDDTSYSGSNYPDSGKCQTKN